MKGQTASDPADEAQAGWKGATGVRMWEDLRTGKEAQGAASNSGPFEGAFLEPQHLLNKRTPGRLRRAAASARS